MTHTRLEEVRALADRCEKAEGPDREIDKAIHSLIDPEHVAYMDRELERLTDVITRMGTEAAKHRLPGLPDHTNTSPRYTGSVDAAIRLVPDDLMWTMDSWSRSQWSAGIWRHQKGWLVHSGIDDQFRSPALALTAASLRAIIKLEADQ